MLSFKKIKLHSADIGNPSTLADIQKPSAIPFFICDKSVDKEAANNFGNGMVASMLPYKTQNMYNRVFEEKLYDAAVLENEYLKAEFIPALGGRLWSLYDKKMQKELVYKNDSLIFANLALRNAWFAGGVEWNIGVRGHTYFTCDNMFARKVIGKDGHEILRMYEYEEIRGLTFCIEATLEADKLLISITVKNTKDEPTYMYWWSNMAVEETENTRIFVPANKTFVTSYRDGGYKISKIGVPFGNNTDISYAKNSNIAIDYFYDIPKENKKWISCLEKDGKGLLQYSDNILQGRKTFMWGKAPGGYHWNKWLTNSQENNNSRNYLEIQAGLCKTQFEHFLINPGEIITWKEVYTGIDINSNDGDYDVICGKIDKEVPSTIDFGNIFNAESVEPITYYGCGKGYLEETLNNKNFSEKCEFPAESVKADEQYYLSLLKNNDYIGDENTAFIYDKKWIPLINAKKEKTFFDFYILGIIYYANLDYEKSYENLLQSVNQKAEYYNLAALGLLCANVRNNIEFGYECLQKAIKINPTYIPLAVKYAEIAIKCEKYSDFTEFYNNSNIGLKENGRMKMYNGQCLVMLGNLEEAKKYINTSLRVEDVREGEYAISNIWIALYKKELSALCNKPENEISDAEVLEKYPIPYEIDFRMH